MYRETDPFLNAAQVARLLDVTPSAVHQWLRSGKIAGKQNVWSRKWKIRTSEALRVRDARETI